MIILISGSGQKAGKTTLANKLGDEVFSLAGAIRQELQLLYPAYDWFNKSQDYKDNIIVKETAQTIRQCLYSHGQTRCDIDPTYWVRKLVAALKQRLTIGDGMKTFCIDDVRKAVEWKYIREAFEGSPQPLLHMHVVSLDATPEPEFENDLLEVCADYVVHW